eukprot:TRINITY_DN49376_c0_g1_i1.p2 TRINITY_DN49376_c0_g1~~TRINITY_DN49376_c0_g1_i1.p2  ORF type:complete len:369 (+),score=88.77 TRINITY_DN49376_c0_g1_i1:73-1107(+)
MVLGVRIHGDVAKDVEVRFDDSCVAIPVTERIGLPVLLKKMSGTGGDDSEIRRSAIVRMMVDPDDGFAPMEWQYGGSRGPAPPVVLGRKDGQPFSVQDWQCLEAFVGDFLDEAAEAEEGRAEATERLLAPDAFKAFVRSKTDEWPAAFLSVRFPVGSVVVPQGLSVAELNGAEGEVVRFSRDRVGVRFAAFPERDVTAIRPERLTLLRDPPPPVETGPASKRHDSGQMKADRAAEVARQDARAIAKRLLDCMYKDEFPERGDLHLFGLGGEYTARATEVMAVWQGCAKGGFLEEDALADALYEGKQRELFEGLCHMLAESRTPNSTYAKALIEARFASLEWDEL